MHGKSHTLQGPAAGETRARGETRAEGQEDLGLHRLFFTVEGLRKLHTAVLADMAYVQDASWHSLTRRLGTYVTDVHAHAGHT